MGLLDGLYKENYKYINALEALDMLAKDERCEVPKIAEFLLAYEYHKCSETYKKNYINQIVPCDDKAVGIVSVDYWAVTNDILEKALENFVYSGNTYSEAYEESDYALYFWLKEDFYNFEGFKKVNFKINDETYEKYLTLKKLDEYESKGVIEQKNKPIDLDYIKKINQIFPTAEQIDTIEPYQNKIDSLIKENEQLQMEIENLKPSQCSVYDHKFFLYKKPLYTINDCACIASELDPLEIHRFPENDIDEIIPEYSMACGLINSAIEAGVLNCFNYKVSAGDLKEYLAKQDIEIKGFNDNEYAQFQISIKEQNKFNDINIATAESEEIKLLKNKIDKLKTALESKDDDLTALAIDLTVTESAYDKLKDELHRKDAEISLLKKRIPAIVSLDSAIVSNQDQVVEEPKENYSDLTPEQEIPHTRQRGSVRKIIAVLVDMAKLPSEPFVAFNMLDAHAQSKGMELPGKDTTVKWTHKSS